MRTHFAGRSATTAAMALILFIFSACTGSSAATSPQDQPKFKEFEDRLGKYMQTHKKAAGTIPSIPKETADAALIVKHQQQLAAAIAALRPNALVGEVFSPPVRQLFIETIKQKTEGKEGAAARATILGEGNPKSAESQTDVKLSVNGTYPTTAPLSTVPPSILMALPSLPKELQYRFVGRNLILLDTEANLIVDFIPNVV
ncbi:MAG TPA: hypothetical protein VFR05_03790 [Terriglobia bacterium]|nr:hypothetical protein [Terriglobia bacterium]